MGLFDKIFGKKDNKTQIKFDINTLQKTGEPLDKGKFWAIIDSSLKKTRNQESQEAFLVKELKKLTPTEMIGFRLHTDKLLYDTYNPDLWCAGYIMNSGCSDDSFEYFRCWVISRGRETYEKAKANPDSLISEVKDGQNFYDFEGFWYVALTAFENTTGQNLYDYIDYDKFTTHEGKYPQFEFNWKEDDPQSMRKICPQLFEKLWE